MQIINQSSLPGFAINSNMFLMYNRNPEAYYFKKAVSRNDEYLNRWIKRGI